MLYRWIYTGCDTQDERNIAAYWDELRPGLEARLKALKLVPTSAILSIHHDHEREADSEQRDATWTVQASLTLPGMVCVGEGQATEMKAAMDECIQTLTVSLNARADDLQNSSRSEDRRAARRVLREDLKGLVPFLEEAHHQRRINVFAGFLRPLLLSLRHHASRELAVLEMEEDVPSGQWDVDELLDETLLLAWEQFDQRPDNVPLDAWIVGLLGQVLENVGREDYVSLSRREDAQPLPYDEGQSTDEWIEQPAGSDGLQLSDLLAGQPQPRSWEQVDPKHRDIGLNYLLKRLSREQRRALLLSALHGLEPDVIAAIQHVSPSQAEAAIDAARNALTRLIEQEEYWPELQESIERHQQTTP